jgi:hypothetical protein
VVDAESQAIIQLIVRLRDDRALSWDSVSDEIDRILAAKQGRKPTLRCNRRGWTKATCRRAYLSAKQGEAPPPTHRRCSKCRQSKPIAEFARHNGRYRRQCRMCRAVRSFSKMENERRQELQVLTRNLVRLARQRRLKSAEAESVLSNLGSLFDDHVPTVVAEWDHLVRMARQQGDAKPLLDLALFLGYGLLSRPSG